MDFTLSTYRNLLYALQKQGFSFLTFCEFILNPKDNVIVLRHDVDREPSNSLEFAKILSSVGIQGTFYFRVAADSWDEGIIKMIAGLGHEIGYHYEDVSLADIRQKTKVKRQKYKNNEFSDLQDRKTARLNDNVHYEEELCQIAIESFKQNLALLRRIVPVKTICMHGSPMSKWDSRLLWKYYDYHDFGIVGEPYFDIDFDQILYLTDTGRRWDGDSFNIRDKATNVRRQVTGEEKNGSRGEENRVRRTASLAPFPKFHSTFNIILAAEQGKLPVKIMMTFHPQRWTDNYGSWVRELFVQNTKNIVKLLLNKTRYNI